MDIDTIEELIKEVLDEIGGIDWSPGNYPQTLADIKTRPAGCWRVTTSSGGSTSTRPDAYTNTTITINLWAATAAARAEASGIVRAAFLACGFAAAPGGQHEVGLEGGDVAYVASLTFTGLIERQTYRVYRQA